jgi:uncharacterized protein (DUF1778 family)
MPASSTRKKASHLRSSRFGLRASKEQETVLRRAAEASHKSLTEFILDSACAAAEQTLLDQRLFLVSGQQHQNLMGLLDAPARTNGGLRKLFSKPAPWDRH